MAEAKKKPAWRDPSTGMTLSQEELEYAKNPPRDEMSIGPITVTPGMSASPDTDPGPFVGYGTGQKTVGDQLMAPWASALDLGQRHGLLPSNKDILSNPVVDYATGGGLGQAQRAANAAEQGASDYVQLGPRVTLPGGYSVPVPLPGPATRSAAQFLYDKILGPSPANIDKDAAATLKQQREAGEPLSNPSDFMKKMLSGAGYGGMGTTPTETKKLGAGPPGQGGGGAMPSRQGDIEKQERLQSYYERLAKQEEYEGNKQEIAARNQMADEASQRANAAEMAHNAAMDEAKLHLQREDDAMKKWSQTKLDPSRLWNSMDGWDRANWHAGVAIGGFLRDLRGGGENEFLQNYNDLVNRDIKSQMDQAEKYKGLADHEGNMFSQLQKLGMSKLDAASKLSEMQHQAMLDRIKAVAMNTGNEADAQRARALVPKLQEQILRERDQRDQRAASAAAAAADKAYNRWLELQRLDIERSKALGQGKEKVDQQAKDIRERTVVGPAGQDIILNRKEDASKYTEKLESLNMFKQKVAQLQQAMKQSSVVGRGFGALGSKTGLPLDTEATKQLKTAKDEVLAAYSKANGLGALDKGLQQFGAEIGLGSGEWDPFSVNEAAYDAMMRGADQSINGLPQSFGGQAAQRTVNPETGLEEPVPENLLLGPGFGARKTPIGNVGP